MMVLAAYYFGRSEERRLRATVKWVVGLVALQVTLGVINVLLYAPGWMQLIHLLVADILWIAAVLLVIFEAEASFRRGTDPQPVVGTSSVNALNEG